MTMAAEGVLHPGNEPPKPERLLRPHWVELIERMWSDHVTDKLFQREIISKRDKDEIEEKAAKSRRKGASLLMDVMLTRSWKQCVEFAVIVSQTDGVKDLGEKLLNLKAWLQHAGARAKRKWLDCGMVYVCDVLFWM